MGCGMLENRKGLDIFLDTAELMLKDRFVAADEMPKLAFVWVGGIPPSETEAANKQISRIGRSPVLSQCVYLLGQVPEADRYFAAADIFFLSSRYDPFPGVVLEAMAAGVPIVCFRSATDVTDAFIPPCGGYALDDINCQEAATALARLVSDANLRMEMGQFARRRLRSHYSFAAYVTSLMPYLFVDVPSGSVDIPAEVATQPVFSIVVPSYRTPSIYLQQLIHSVINQSYSHFELIIAASELSPLSSEYLVSASKFDARIKPLFLEKNEGISGNTNAALAMVAGSHLGFLDHDDLLHSRCLQRIAEVIISHNPEVIYTDEDKVDATGTIFHSPVRKPGFDRAQLEANNYITHFTVVKHDILGRIGKLREEYDGAQDYDFILRATDSTERIWHIPEVLYHWRESEQSTSSGQSEAKPYAIDAGKRALQDHLHRLNRHDEIAENTEQPFVYRIRKS